MTRIAWITDPHLNFVEPADTRTFWESVAAAGPDVVLVGGDTGEAHNVLDFLRLAASILQRPIYFVLGNHDFYRGSIVGVRRAVEGLAAESEHLAYLPSAGVVSLTPQVALVGVDGWGDGRAGNFDTSPVVMSDFLLIEDLAGLNKAARLTEINMLGDEAGDHVRRVLPEALESHPRAILLTHVPPFREACWHEGRISDLDFLPFFVCQAVGDALLAAAEAHPQREVLVLCGHSHGEGSVQVRDNLTVLTGGVEYGQPTVQRVFNLPA